MDNSDISGFSDFGGMNNQTSRPPVLRTSKLDQSPAGSFMTLDLSTIEPPHDINGVLTQLNVARVAEEVHNGVYDCFKDVVDKKKRYKTYLKMKKIDKVVSDITAQREKRLKFGFILYLSSVKLAKEVNPSTEPILRESL